VADASAQPEAEAKEKPGPVSKKGLRLEELGPFGTALAAVGSGIGALGIVAFFGAAILWVRMDEVGIPANEAIAVVPKSVLVTTGASFLVPSVLLAVVLLGVLYLVDRLVPRLVELLFLRDRKKDLENAKMEARRRQTKIKRTLEKAEKAAEHSIRLKATAQKAVAAGANPNAVRKSSTEASDAVTEAQLDAGQAQPAAKQTEDAVEEAEEEVELERDRRKLPIESTEKGLRFLSIVLVLVAAAIPGVLLSAVGLEDEQIELIAVAVLFLSPICLVVLASTNFAWFALAIVVAVCLLNGFVTYLRTTKDPKVEPTAVLRSNGPPVFGFFVAQTSDRIYLATRLPTGPLRLDAIPREEVTDMAVGKDLRPGLAEIRARRLARQMCAMARERAKARQTVAMTSAKRKPAAEPCTLADLRRLTGSPPKTGRVPAT
jgi:hypothetical protein